MGTSGWQHRDWRGRSSPQELPRKLWLEDRSQHVATVASERSNGTMRLRPDSPAR